MVVRGWLYHLLILNSTYSIVDIIKTIDTEKLPGYKRLLTEEYWKIDDDEFDGVIEEVIDNLKTGKINLVDMVKLFGYFDYFIKKQNVNALYLITDGIYNHRNKNNNLNGVIEVPNFEYYAKELLSLPKSKKVSKTYIKTLTTIWFYLQSDSALSKAIFEETEKIKDELNKMNEYIDETFFKPSAPALPEGTQNINE